MLSYLISSVEILEATAIKVGQLCILDHRHADFDRLFILLRFPDFIFQILNVLRCHFKMEFFQVHLRQMKGGIESFFLTFNGGNDPTKILINADFFVQESVGQFDSVFQHLQTLWSMGVFFL